MSQPSARPSAYAANVPRFYLYRAGMALYFPLPIWVIYLTQLRGLSLTEVTLLDAVFWLTAAAGEIPTGAIADTFGRRTSIAVGVAVGALGQALFGLTGAFPLLLAANVLRGLSVSCLSGAEQAFLYDSLRAAERQDDYPRVAGRSIVLVQGGFVLASLIGGVVGARDLALPFFLFAALSVAVLGVVLTFAEPPREGPASARRGYRATLREAGQAVRGRPALRQALVYAALLPLASFVVGIIFLQPHALALGVPIGAMGLLVMANRGAAMLGSASGHRLLRAVGERRLLVGAPVLTVAGLLALAAANSVPGLLGFGIVTFAATAARPVAESLVFRHAPAAVRATIMSAESLLFTLLVAVAEPILGGIGDRHGFPLAYLALAAGVAAGIGAVLLWWTRTGPEARAQTTAQA